MTYNVFGGMLNLAQSILQVKLIKLLPVVTHSEELQQIIYAIVITFCALHSVYLFVH